MKQGTYLILQTAVETDRALAEWADFVAADRYFELGRDPALIARMERDLEQLNKRLEELDGHLKLGYTPVQQIHSYFRARGELEKAAAVVRDIRHQDRGSTRSTAQFLAQVESCRHRLFEMMSLLRPNPSSTLH